MPVHLATWLLRLFSKFLTPRRERDDVVELVGDSGSGGSRRVLGWSLFERGVSPSLFQTLRRPPLLDLLLRGTSVLVSTTSDSGQKHSARFATGLLSSKSRSDRDASCSNSGGPLAVPTCNRGGLEQHGALVSVKLGLLCIFPLVVVICRWQTASGDFSLQGKPQASRLAFLRLSVWRYDIGCACTEPGTLSSELLLLLNGLLCVCMAIDLSALLK